MPQAHIEHCVLLYACTFGWSAYKHFTVLTKQHFVQWKTTACRAQDVIMKWPFLADSMVSCINTPVPSHKDGINAAGMFLASVITYSH